MEPQNISASSQRSDNKVTQDFIAIYFFCGLIGFLAVLSNSLALFLIKKHAFLRTPTNICLASLACSDLLAGLLTIPLVITCSESYRFAVCLAMELTQRLIALSTILHLLVIACERYFNICRPMSFPNLSRKSRIFGILAAVWCFSMAASLIQLAWIILTENKSTSVQLKTTEIIYDLIWVFVFVVIPFLTIIVLHFSIFLALKRQVRNIAKQYTQVERKNQFNKTKRERKAILIYGAMVVTFAISWFSYIFSAIAEDLGSKVFISTELATFLALLRYSASVVNPLLYTFLKGDFKKALAKTCFVRLRKLSTKNKSRYSNIAIPIASTNL